MRAVILDPGMAERMRLLRANSLERVEKSQLFILNRTVLEWAVQGLSGAGIADITLITRQPAPTTVARCKELGVHCVDISKVAGALAAIREVNLPAAPTLFLFGDTIIHELDYQTFRSAHESTAAGVTLLRGKPADLLDVNSRGEIAYGIVDCDPQGRFRSFHEKPNSNMVSAADYAFCGAFCAGTEALRHLINSPANAFHHWLADYPGKISVSTSRYYADVGTPQRYWRTNLDLFPVHSAPVLIGHNAFLARTAKCTGKVIVGHGSFVGDHAYLEDSVVLPGSRIEPGSSIVREIILPDGRLPM